MGFSGIKCRTVGQVLLMRLYRIGSSELLKDFSGLGASHTTGARWNIPGVPALYFASSASVAMVEMANYIPSPYMIPKS